MRKKILISGILLSFISTFFGCAELMNPTKVTSTSPQTVAQAQREPALGPKARLAVMSFENKTGTHYQTQVKSSVFGGTVSQGDPIGDGMSEQIVTALVQTNRFIVLERQAVQDILKEQELGASGRVKTETAAQIGEVEGAEFLIYGAVTEFTAQQAEIGGGVGTQAGSTLGTIMTGGLGGGLVGGVIGGLAEKVFTAGMSQDHVAIDIRLVDAKTGRIVNATSVEGKPRDIEAGIGGLFGNTLIGLSGSYKTPIQKAVRACIINAVNWVGANAFAEGVVRSQATTPTQYIPEEKASKNTISQVQQKLKEIGYNPGSADGVMGKKTKAAIQQYQKSKGLDETGEINQATLASLGITE